MWKVDERYWWERAWDAQNADWNIVTNWSLGEISLNTSHTDIASSNSRQLYAARSYLHRRWDPRRQRNNLNCRPNNLDSQALLHSQAVRAQNLNHRHRECLVPDQRCILPWRIPFHNEGHLDWPHHRNTSASAVDNRHPTVGDLTSAEGAHLTHDDDVQDSSGAGERNNTKHISPLIKLVLVRIGEETNHEIHKY